MKLALDAGNSYLKWAILGTQGIEQSGTVRYADQTGNAAPASWISLPRVETIVLCSVAPAATTRGVIQWCQQRWSCPIQTVRSQAEAHGVTNAYPLPETLGADRWVALIGAHHRFPGDKCIVDAGTAITIDLLQANGHHQGGLIAPGYQSMLRALQTSTDLPTPTAGPGTSMSPGTNTADCIHTGALCSLVGLIRVATQQFGDGNSTLIVTGGTAARLIPHLPPQSIHDPELIFHGLAVIAGSQP